MGQRSFAPPWRILSENGRCRSRIQLLVQDCGEDLVRMEREREREREREKGEKECERYRERHRERRGGIERD